MEHAQIAEREASQTSVPAAGIWRTIRGYILWSYERGTIQYDVMVTLILLFVFLSPVWINFKDKPVERTPHRTGVTVYPDVEGRFIYQVDAKAVPGGNDAAVRDDLRRVIEPISGEISITRYEAITDGSGHILYYRVWVER